MSTPSPNQRADPWAHRRAEPRTLALLWLVYLIISLFGGVLWMLRSAMVVSGYAPAARIMLVVIAVGVCLLWPMVRLSQASPQSDRRPGAPRGPVAAALADLFVILLPVQVIVWPLSLIARWPADVAGALALLFACWALVAAAVVALGTGRPTLSRPRDPRLVGRTWWMVACLAVVLAAPLAAWTASIRGATMPTWVRTCSPISGISSLTGRGLSGAPAPVTVAQWGAIVATGFLGVAGLGAAVSRAS